MGPLLFVIFVSDLNLNPASLHLDSRKAFDEVNHGRLFSQLELYGIKSKFVWFQNDMSALSTPIPVRTVLRLVSHKVQFGTSAICYFRQ